MKFIIWLLRIVVGVLFIFSGLVKANDPLGLSYKMNEFFEVWNMAWMMPYALMMSVAMIAFEIIAGVALLLGYAQKLFSILLLLLITFFTFLTAYVLFSGKIKECGCFGDCIKITNEETFWKDVALLVFGFILFLYRKKINPLLPKTAGNVMMVLTVAFAFGIQWWTLEHLPFYDCLPYKIGADAKLDSKIPPGAIPDKYETIMVYEKDGVKKEFNMQNYPWQDSTWKFVTSESKLISKGNAEPKMKDFVITDYDGNDHTEELLNTPGYTFLLFVKDPDFARKDNLETLHGLIKQAQQQAIPFYVLCSADKDRAMLMQKNWGLVGVDFLVLDQTACKTAMRTNPGLMLLEQGVIRGKWSFKDYPKNISLSNGKLNIAN